MWLIMKLQKRAAVAGIVKICTGKANWFEPFEWFMHQILYIFGTIIT